MARRKKEDAELTREAILDAAGEVFREKGVARTRMEDIATGADCTRGAVYWHFRNKTDVLIALSERVSLPLYDRIRQILAAQPDDPLGAWRTHLLDSMRTIETDKQQQNTCDILVNRCELGEDMAALSELENQRSAFFIESSRQLFQLAQAKGELAAETDAAQLALITHATVLGLLRLWLRQRGSFPLRESVAAAADLLLAGARIAPRG
ncbi:MAG TPA: TetR family transcriptional regulator [Chiayiivirga sp.]|nr:TetR family transcriptional regulator [Chiayiivirga sp.]